jgi:hypothetical protein
MFGRVDIRLQGDLVSTTTERHAEVTPHRNGYRTSDRGMRLSVLCGAVGFER